MSFRFICLLPALLLGACNKEAPPPLDIHDSKYLRVDARGQPGDATADAWPCVLDQYTGLTWEVKTDQPGLHHRDHTYSWYRPEESHDDQTDYRGTANGGNCSASDCDTHALTVAVNVAGLCGYHDWRMPTRDELASISDLRKTANPPTVNALFFPHTQVGEYWSANDYSFQSNSAWLWNFEFGHDRVEWKASPRYVRLVRGDPQHLMRVKD